MQRYKEKRVPRKSATSWEAVGKWYHGLVGEEGHYYHRQIILPGVMHLLEGVEALLDLACGNGVLARQLPEGVAYLGLDASPSLIKAAKKGESGHAYEVADVAKPLNLSKNDFSHATLILAAQNMAHLQQVMRNAERHLRKEGKFILVINHPCFRIPRQSSWGVDEGKKIQYRRVDRYHSEMKIPIQMHPSQKEQSAHTLSFHHPLATYTLWLYEAGFAVDWMEEWYSDKVSTGKMARMENRGREEIPLFLAIRATKRN